MDSDEDDVVESDNRSYTEDSNVKLIKEFDESSESSIDDELSEEENNVHVKTDKKSAQELATINAHIQKLVRHMKTGNHGVTLSALSTLKNEDLHSNVIQEAIKNTEGLQILVNILETNDQECKVATLIILQMLTETTDMAREIVDLGAIPQVINILDDNSPTLQKLSALIIANVSKLKKSRKIVRKSQGLPKLVRLLQIPDNLLKIKKSELNAKDREILEVVSASCRAISIVSVSSKCKIEIHNLKAIAYFVKMLRSCHEDLIEATLGIVTHCSSQGDFQLELQKAGIIEDMVYYLSNENDEIKKLCSIVIFQCARNDTTCNMIRQFGGLDPIVSLMTNEKTRRNKTLLASVTGAVWKCLTNVDNIRRLDELETIPILVQLLVNESEVDVLTHTVGAIAECVKLPHNHVTLLKADGIPPVVNLLNYTDENLLENVCKIVTQCAVNEDCMQQIVQNDGLRLLWSLLRSESCKVQASAAWALVPCIQNMKNSAEMIRSFAGGLELLVSLLESKDIRVLSCVCATIAEVAKNEENLAVITDLEVVDYLARLVCMKDESLREHLAAAIANCCAWESNCTRFGGLNAVKPLVSYIKSKNTNVQRATALALYKLSADPMNCITLHNSGVVKLLLRTIASRDEQLQDSSAGCLSNIRNLALKLSNRI